MTSAMLTDLLKSLGLLGGALMVGVFLRSKLGFLQKTFIPASVIGGFLLLLLGPQVFNVTGKLGVPTEWYSYYSMIPGILIVPVVAGVPLGLRLNRKGSEGMDSGFIKNVFPLFFKDRIIFIISLALNLRLVSLADMERPVLLAIL